MRSRNPSLFITDSKCHILLQVSRYKRHAHRTFKSTDYSPTLFKAVTVELKGEIVVEAPVGNLARSGVGMVAQSGGRLGPLRWSPL